MNAKRKIRTGIVGAKALTAGVLMEILLRHPNAALCYLAGRDEEELDAVAYFPELRGRLEPTPSGGRVTLFDAEACASACDAVFLCLPHKTAAGTARELRDRDVVVIDLSADFRYDDLAVYERIYGVEHPARELNAAAPYALAEHAGAALAGAGLIAVPGCYPTSVQLPLVPLLRAGLLDLAAPIIADSKSGVSGAGRKPTDKTHFCSANEAFSAYSVGAHRHESEIAEKLATAAAAGGATTRPSVVFTPHLVPMDRGILSTIYVRPADPKTTAADLRARLAEFYASWPLVRVLPAGAMPTTKAVSGTGFADLAVFDHAASDMKILFGAIDNLWKGASSQAVQAMNLRYGLPDARGILPGV